MSGIPCFVGTRVPIKHLWDYLDSGATLEELLDDFEGVPREEVMAALRVSYQRLLGGLPEVLTLLPAVQPGQVYFVLAESDSA